MHDPRMTEAFLRREYLTLQKSPYQIGEELGINSGRVRRALAKLGIPLRTRSQAQKLALYSGRRENPTLGKERPQEVRDRISDSVLDYWERMTPEQREAEKAAKAKFWMSLTPGEKMRMGAKARSAVTRAGSRGTKLEHAIFQGLKAAGYWTAKRKKGADLFLPKQATAIVVDGPFHFYPIYGEVAFQKTIDRDKLRDAEFEKNGYRVLRVHCHARNLNRKKIAWVLQKLVYLLQSPDSTDTTIEVT